jgi:hypothetical protein
MAVSEVTNLIIYKGADFDVEFDIFQADNSELILNNLGTSFATIRKFPKSQVFENFDVEIPPSTGTVKLSLTPEQTSNLETGRNYFDVILTISGKRIPVLKGSAIVEDSCSV